MTGSGVEFSGLLKRQGEVRVGVCRVLSRQVATWRDREIVIVHAPSVSAGSSAPGAIHSQLGQRCRVPNVKTDTR